MHNELLIGICTLEEPHQLVLPFNIHVQKTQGGCEPFILTVYHGLGDVSQELKKKKKKPKPMAIQPNQKTESTVAGSNYSNAWRVGCESPPPKFKKLDPIGCTSHIWRDLLDLMRSQLDPMRFSLGLVRSYWIFTFMMPIESIATY